ncbi:hypothetical protein PHMEG_00041112, partial [Phytophthora megakarya]
MKMAWRRSWERVSLPGNVSTSWEIVAATGHFLEKATVNEAEYAGLVKGMQLALNAGIQELVVVGDSRLAIKQLQGVIDCTQPHLLRLLQEAEGLQAKFKSLRLVHVKRDFNAAADYISKRVIQEQSSLEVTDLGERKLLQGLNRIHEKLMKDPSPREQPLPRPGAYLGNSPGGEEFVTTRSASKQSKVAEESTPESGVDNLEAVGPGVDEPGTEGAGNGPIVGPRNLDPQGSEEDPEDARRERWRRICSHQTHDPGLAPL